MLKFIVRRLLQMVLVFFGATIILFSALFLFGNPLNNLTGSGHARTPAVIHTLEAKYSLDKPFYVQYYKYVEGLVVHFDLGTSYRQQNREVAKILPPKLENTAKLALFAIIIEIIVGLAAGIISAVFRYSFIDVIVTILTTVTIGVPVFVIGILLQEVFALQLHWLPLFGLNDGFKSYILPAIALASIDAALVARLTRGSMLEVMRADYVRTATAKGLSKRVVIFKHVLRNSIIPVVTYLGISFGTLLGGALITENVFSLDGIGNALVTAIKANDNPIIMGVVTYGVLVFVIVNLIVDLLYAVLDPRVRLE
ncbi:MAG TPA: ABC transporter permease [Frankiaceae bacterium]|nr:ABC transporter permease [Frankiaceae bacterium]